MTDRPDYITCIKHNHEDFKNETWCSKPINGFVFESLDHAANNDYNGGRLVACKDCTNAAIYALTAGQEEEELPQDPNGLYFGIRG